MLNTKEVIYYRVEASMDKEEWDILYKPLRCRTMEEAEDFLQERKDKIRTNKHTTQYRYFRIVKCVEVTEKTVVRLFA